MTAAPFTTLLVANRGEIARRIMRSARGLGLRCVAVFVDADAGAPHVREADLAVRIGSHLDIDAILAAAATSGAGAVHPGYGFLAENAEAAAAIEAAGLVWVGPSPDAIRAMGDKIEAKRLAAEAGVPVLPSSDDLSDLASIGFPLLIKAAAGGGGKGMRVVAGPDELDEAVASARREAQGSFGDDRVFAERYVPRSRHIEIQILGDHHGALVHLGERECSIQRRHQKIIEEAPSPALDAQRREEMGAAACRLGTALGYRSAGTVEFLVDDTTGEWFFLEVNTRLQVEHPVTEAVTGIDLVREQLRLAAGEPLGYGQADISVTGHAIEARLYAEDPDNAFLPTVGTVEAFTPAAEPAVRWDTGVEPGSAVTVDFDPMIAKVIAAAPTRHEAAARLALALERCHLGGVVTNREFLAATLRHEAFVAGDTTTDFLDVHTVTGARLDPEARAWFAVAAAMWRQGRNHAEAPVLRTIPSGMRIGRLAPERVTVEIDGEPEVVAYRAMRGGGFVIGEDAERGRVVIHRWDHEAIDLEYAGIRRSLRVTAAGARLHLTGGDVAASVRFVPRFHVPEPDLPGGGVAAPMPGKVLELRVDVGATVSAGDVVAVLEAMKMENHLRAAHDGVVTEVRVAVGDQIDKDTLVMVIDDGSDTAGEGDGDD